MKRSRGKDADSSSKKSKTISSTVSRPERKENEEGDPFWQISPKRRVTLSEFKGNTLIGIREFYEKDGKTLPGKSGISLTVEQFTTLALTIPDIKKALAGQGFDISEHDDNDSDDVKDEKSESEQSEG